MTLVLGILEKARGITTKRLWELVRELPIGLNDLYDKILSKIASESEEGGNCDLVRQILTWAVLAARPLTLAELRIALAVKLNTTSIDENEVIRNIREVETLCGAFVEIVPAQISAEVHESSESIQLEDEEHSADTVRLIHQSAKDYLLDRLFKLKEPISVFRIEPPKGHLEISLQCLTYLLFDEFDDKRKQSGLHGRTAAEAFGDDEDGSYEAMVLQDKLERHPFLNYASVHWPFHVRQISPMEGQEIIHLACKFLCSPANFQNSLRIRSYLKDPNLRYSHSPSALNFAASLGLYHVVEDLLKDHRIDINEPDDLGEATLSAVAITAGDHLSEKPRIVQLLIDRGARLTCCPCHGRSPLQWAITNSGHLELCKVFLNNGAASETFDIG